MSKEILIVISAICGGIFTVIVSYLNFKGKKFELEYNYNVSRREKRIENAKQKASTIYLPITSHLEKLFIEFRQIKNSDWSKFIEELEKLKIRIKDLKISGEIIYLDNEIEKEIIFFIEFLENSTQDKNIRYSFYHRYSFLGEEYSFLERISNDNFRRKLIIFYKVCAFFLEIFMNLFPGKFMNGIVNYQVKIVYNSAKKESKEFEKQFEVEIKNIKEKIRKVMFS